MLFETQCRSEYDWSSDQVFTTFPCNLTTSNRPRRKTDKPNKHKAQKSCWVGLFYNLGFWNPVGLINRMLQTSCSIWLPNLQKSVDMSMEYARVCHFWGEPKINFAVTDCARPPKNVCRFFIAQRVGLINYSARIWESDVRDYVYNMTCSCDCGAARGRDRCKCYIMIMYII